MESGLISSLTKPYFLPSFHSTSRLCSPPPGGVRGLEHKAVIYKRKLPMCKGVGITSQKYVPLSWKGSDYSMASASASASDHHHFESQPISSVSQLKTLLQRNLDAFYQFSRLYSIIGVVLSVISVSLLSVEKLSDLSPLFLIRVSEAVAATACMVIYSNGLNQLADQEIDKINKPHLPLPSGVYSVKTAMIITAFFAIMSLGFGCFTGCWPFFRYILVNLAIQTGYSMRLPFLRWKKSGILTALAAFSSRINMHLGIYSHIQTCVFGRSALYLKSLIFPTLIMSVFAVVLMFLKDIPDIDGDKIEGIQSLAIQFGQAKMFWTSIALLQMVCLLGIIAGLTSSQNWTKVILVAGNILMALILWNRAKCVDPENKASTQSFYLFAWKLFDAEYLLVPLMR